MEDFELGVVEAAERIRARTLKAADYAHSLLERCEALDAQLCAMVFQDSSRVLYAAKEIDRRLDSGETVGPLAGIPVGVKDIYDSAGVPTGLGIKGGTPNIPAFSAPSVESLYKAGAVLFGKTATTDRAYMDPCETRNPWDSSRTPGGSSSGSAAGVAARLFPVALGSQTGGSVIRPASFCGVVGMTLTPGRVPIDRGVLPLAPSFDMPGFFVRSVEDAEYFTVAWCGVSHLEDLDPPGAPETVFDRPVFLGFARRFLEFTDDEAAHKVLHSARSLSDHGAIVHVLKMPEIYETFMEHHPKIFAHEASRTHSKSFDANPENFSPRIAELIEIGRKVTTDEYRVALAARDTFRHAMLARLDEVDALVLPSTVGAAPDLSTTGDPTCNAPWTAIGFPAVTLPCDLTEDGLPLSMQIVGRPGGERRLLWVARFCEQALEFGCPSPL